MNTYSNKTFLKRWPLFLSALNHPVPQKLVVEKNGIGEPVLKIDMTIDYNPLVFDKDSAVNRIEILYVFYHVISML